MAATYPTILVLGTEPALTRAVTRCLRLAGAAPLILATSNCWTLRLLRDDGCGGRGGRYIRWNDNRPSPSQLRQVCASENIAVVIAADVQTSLLLCLTPGVPACAMPSAATINLLGDKGQLRSLLDRIGGSHQLQPPVAGWDVGASFLALQGRVAACSVFRGRRHFYHSRRVREYIEQLVVASAYQGVGHLRLRYDPASDSYHILSLQAGFDAASLVDTAQAGVNYPDLLARPSATADMLLPRAGRVRLALPR
jgi:hypothetical protein